MKDLPKTPGVYIFKDNKGNVLYVGKAKKLRSRVGSYFTGKLDKSSKTYALVQKIEDIEHIEVLSELDALILEAELIKRYNPKYNIVLKDDKSYLYIVIRKGKFPAVLPLRKPDIKKGDLAFGPYPSSSITRYIVRTLRKFFPFRDCSVTKFKRYQKLKRSCLFGQIDLCPAPCVNKVTANYKRNIRRIKTFLKGDSNTLINNLEEKMKKASEEKKYEIAAKYRDLIKKFEYTRQVFRTPQQYIDNPYLVDDLAAKALDDLVEKISILKKIPRRIECYDISNISGKAAVGSMVVAVDGKIKKREYRKFKIRMKEEPNDVGMMVEVLKRRLRRITQTASVGNSSRGSWPAPDLIVLDGGKGHVSKVLNAAKGLDIPIVGIAKRFEKIIYKDTEGIFAEAAFGKDSEGLKLLIALRNEAHRFAQRYHHLLRLRNLSGV